MGWQTDIIKYGMIVGGAGVGVYLLSRKISGALEAPAKAAGEAWSATGEALGTAATAAGHAILGQTSSAIYVIKAFDNGSFTSQAISVGSKTSAPALSGSASAQVTSQDFFQSGQVVSTSSAVYVIAPILGDPDNYSLTTIGGSTTNH